MTIPAQAAARLTAREAIDRMKRTLAEANVAWRTDTVDTVKAGDPEWPITGVATTFMATFDVIKRAVAAGANLVITHEPTFYNHQDGVTAFANDAVFRAKMAFIEANRVVVFRFHDHWHARRPDGVRVGLLRALGWPAGTGPVVIPPVTFGQLASDIQRRLTIRAMRVVGNPTMSVSRIAVGLGYGNPPLTNDVDVVVTGESQEADSAWDNMAYAVDSQGTSQPKGLILLGHERSEGFGMDECAMWLRPIVPEVPVTFIQAGEPFRAGV